MPHPTALLSIYALCVMLCAAAPGGAQSLPSSPAAEPLAPVTLDPAAIVGLALLPWQSREGFLQLLDGALSGVTVERPRLPEGVRADDPWLWSIAGRFGTPVPGIGTPGGIVVCARYGIETRDLMAQSSLSDPGVFMLLGATLAASDDAQVWPEGAIARLSCMMTWDDTRRVAILPPEPVQAALEAQFARVARSGDAEFYGERWQDYAPIFGDDGYRFDGQDGQRDSVVVVESALIERRVSHQRIVFRSFLMAGGM